MFYARGSTGTKAMKLMGIDVGFSTRRATTGIACLDGEQLCIARAGTAWQTREAAIPRGFQPSVIAFDGPLLPRGADLLMRRHCESVFVHAPFHNRCKPGLSHWGHGLKLRRAAAEACAQFGPIVACSVTSQLAAVSRHGPVVEAFPNAFLGVLTPEADFLSAPRFGRGRRFDWLYERVVSTGALQSGLSQVLDLPVEVWRRLRLETDHELRAALICLLTAALADQGKAAVVGEESGGWFWLPPWFLWQPWASRGLDGVLRAIASRDHPIDLPSER
jgi:hypothetical protein